ncbi:MAG: DnaJ domain-containing protein [Rhodobacteraceae bacterium]|nr:DnaJ domain-containing protein [Paracoccaceae bacterium]
MTDDPYAVLGVAPTASAEDIKSAFRRIARLCHPDLNPDAPDAEARFKAASVAFDLLKDPARRAAFDRQSRTSRAQNDSAAGGQAYNKAARSQARRSDIYSDFMRKTTGQAQAAEPGRRFALKVAFADAMRGGRMTTKLPDGTPIAVPVPPGASDGQVLTVPSASGDVQVILNVPAHPVFRRQGHDIHITLPITIDEAVLGARISAPTLDGPVPIDVPAGANPGHKLRLRGRGAPLPDNTGKRGDQIVELWLTLPEHLDRSLTAFMDNWRDRFGYNPREGMTV